MAAKKELAVKVKVKLDTSKAELQKQLITNNNSVQNVISKITPIKIPVTVDKKALEASIKEAFGKDSLKKFKDSLKNETEKTTKNKVLKGKDTDEEAKAAAEATRVYRDLVEAEKERVVWEQKLSNAKVNPEINTEGIKQLEENLNTVNDIIDRCETKLYMLNGFEPDKNERHSNFLDYLDRKTDYASSAATDKTNTKVDKEKNKEAEDSIKRLCKALDEETAAWKKLNQAKIAGNKDNEALYKTEYENAKNKTKEAEAKATDIMGDSWKNNESYLKAYSKSQLEVKNSTNKLNEALSKQADKVSKLKNKFIDVETTYTKLEKQTPEVTESFNKLSSILSSSSLSDTEKLKQFNDELSRFNSLSRKNSAENVKTRQDIATETARSNLYSTALAFTQKNTRVLKDQDIGEPFRKLLNDLKNGSGDVEKLSRDFAKLRAQAIEAGLATETLGEKIKKLWDEHLKTAMVMAGIHMIQQGLQQVYTNVVQIDTAMTELKKVTDETDKAYDQFLNNAGTRAKEIGATVTDVVNATADFARLGYNLQDATTLADATLVYKNVGDGISDINEASSSLISTMQAFGVEAKNTMNIVDEFNAAGK